MISRTAFAATVLAVALHLAAGPARASCMEPPPLEQDLARADVVFVGTVYELADNGRTARVEVHEVWSGPDLPERVEVHGGPGEPDLATSVDRHFQADTRYLFAASVRDGRLQDDSCTATQAWTEELAALRPESHRAPLAITEATGGPPLPLVIAAIGVAAILSAGYFAFRQRH
jgi:hypothetical protein